MFSKPSVYGQFTTRTGTNGAAACRALVYVVVWLALKPAVVLNAAYQHRCALINILHSAIVELARKHLLCFIQKSTSTLFGTPFITTTIALRTAVPAQMQFYFLRIETMNRAAYHYFLTGACYLAYLRIVVFIAVLQSG